MGEKLFFGISLRELCPPVQLRQGVLTGGDFLPGVVSVRGI